MVTAEKRLELREAFASFCEAMSSALADSGKRFVAGKRNGVTVVVASGAFAGELHELVEGWKRGGDPGVESDPTDPDPLAVLIREVLGECEKDRPGKMALRAAVGRAQAG